MHFINIEKSKSSGVVEEIIENSGPPRKLKHIRQNKMNLSINTSKTSREQSHILLLKWMQGQNDSLIECELEDIFQLERNYVNGPHVRQSFEQNVSQWENARR